MKKYFFLSIILLSLGCKKHNVSNVNVFQPSDFPLAIGNKWKYLLSDLYAGTQDTVITFLFNKVQLSKDTQAYYFAVSDAGKPTDTDVILLYNNILSILPSTYNSPWGQIHLMCPLYDGKYWSDRPSDTTRVLSVTSGYKLLYNVFDSVFYVRRDSRSSNTHYSDVSQFCPRIGIIENNYIAVDPSGYNAQVTALLISYELH